MSGPSFSNIDLWLFELAEGNLSAGQEEQLRLFLLQHPDVDVDKESWEIARVSPVNAVYEDQHKLIRKRKVAWFYYASAVSIALLFFATINSKEALNIITNNLIAEATTPIKQQKITAYLNMSSLSNENNKVDIEKERTLSQETTSTYNRRYSSVFNVPTGMTNENEFSTSSLLSKIERASKEGVEITREILSNPFILDEPAEISSDLIDNVIVDVESEPSKTDNFQAFNYLDQHEILIKLSKNDNSHYRNEINYSDGIVKETMKNDVATLIQIDEEIASSTESLKRFPSFSSSNYKMSFKSRLNKFSKALKRMADNPVALKNYRNPSYHLPGMLANDISFSSTGALLTKRVQAQSRVQWLGKKNERLMNKLSIDGYSYGIRGGIGLQLNHSLYNNGGLNVADVALTYSPKLSLNRSISIEPSIRFKMGAKTIRPKSMDGIEMVELERQGLQEFNSSGSSAVKKLWFKDLGLGLMLNTKWFYIGAQVDNLFKHKDNIYSSNETSQKRASHDIIATMGTDWVSKHENMSFSPYIVYQSNEFLSEAWLGANFRLNWFTIGTGVSTSLDPSASIGLKFDRFSLRYNADYSQSEMIGERVLSHQLSLRIVGKTSHFGKRILNL